MPEARLRAALNRLRDAFLYRVIPILYPANCGGCGWPGAWFCERCASQIEQDPGPGCWRCGRPGRRRLDCERCREMLPERLTILRSAFVFGGPMRQSIHRFKYVREYRRGDDLGVRLALRAREVLPSTFRPDVIVPVPLHPRRLRQRGFNQAEILAQHVGESFEVPLVLLLERTRNTPSQIGLSGHEREQNVRDAFRVRDDAEAVQGSRILLIDDVSSTGSTIAAAANALQAGGAAEIAALVLAREGP